MGKQIPVISTQCPECGHTSYHNEDCGEGDVKPALRRAVERADLITENAQLRDENARLRERLGMNPQTLFSRMKKLGISRPT